jgi:hypothetical protein
MSFEDPTVIEAGGHRITIGGRPLRGEPVRVAMDGETASLPLTGDVETVRKPAKYVARFSNGASIVDKPAKQVIRLPSGAHVERKPAKSVIVFGDGSKLVDKPAKTTFRGARFRGGFAPGV